MQSRPYWSPGDDTVSIDAEKLSSCRRIALGVRIAPASSMFATFSELVKNVVTIMSIVPVEAAVDMVLCSNKADTAERKSHTVASGLVVVRMIDGDGSTNTAEG